MKPASAIIIFTKDRPNVLTKTLDNIRGENIPIIILDDSYFIKNRIDNKNVAKRYACVMYHGKDQQLEFFGKEGIDRSLLAKFANRLGAKGWNLGYSRNYALILAKSLRLEKTLFMDDDIIVEDEELISETFSLLDKYDFVGAKIIGMLDDSVVGYIVRELNQPPEEYLSGGFIAFKPHLISEYFLNLYNEDWIWLYFHQVNNSLYQYGEVKQLSYNNFKNARKKAKSQEIGEVIIDGIREIIPKHSLDALMKPSLWRKMLLEKRDYYEHLKILSLRENRRDFHRILCAATNYSRKLHPTLFSTIFNDYFRERQLWLKLLSTV
jgi:hypothetical protein